MKKELINLGFNEDNILTLYGAIPDGCDYSSVELIINNWGPKEIFIDGGSLNFGSSFSFLKNCPSAHKVYAFECSPINIAKVENAISQTNFKNINFIKAALWNENCQLRFGNESTPGTQRINDEGDALVDAVTLDSVINILDKITFIKLDIEGSEINALMGMSKTIQKDKPKLAICLYHKAYDYFEIPEYILKLNPNYKLFLRQYSPNCVETILFAI